jgi:hypothetical protein
LAAGGRRPDERPHLLQGRFHVPQRHTNKDEVDHTDVARVPHRLQVPATRHEVHVRTPWAKHASK